MSGHFQLDKKKSIAASLEGFTVWGPCDPSSDPWNGSQIFFWVFNFASYINLVPPAIGSCIDLRVSNDYKAQKANLNQELKGCSGQPSKYAEPKCKAIYLATI